MRQAQRYVRHENPFLTDRSIAERPARSITTGGTFKKLAVFFKHVGWSEFVWADGSPGPQLFAIQVRALIDVAHFMVQ